MKKICMFTIGDLFNNQTGGKKRFLELHHYLITNNYQVDLFCGNSQEELEQNQIKGFSLEMNGKNKGFLNIPSHNIYINNKEIYKKIKNSNYDYVISFDVPSTIGLCLKKIPNIYYFIRQDFLGYRKIQYESLRLNKIKKYILLFIGWIMESFCLMSSKKIILQCYYDLEIIKKRHLILKNIIQKKSKIQINNINPSWIINNLSTLKNSICKKMNKKTYDVIFVGNFDDERKGYKLFLEAMELLYKNNRMNLKCIMLGGGKYLKSAKEKYKDNSNIIFTDYIKNPAEFIINSKLMVVPSYTDSCPNTVLEALFLGIPVIGSNRSGIPEILNNKEWLFELKAEILALKLKDIFINNRLEKICLEQKERAKKLSFDWGETIYNILGEQDNV